MYGAGDDAGVIRRKTRPISRETYVRRDIDREKGCGNDARILFL